MFAAGDLVVYGGEGVSARPGWPMMTAAGSTII